MADRGDSSNPGPVEVGRADFNVARKGYDQVEVRNFLQRASQSLAAAHDEIREQNHKIELLERDLQAMRRALAEVPRSIDDLDEDALTEALGNEAARVLQAAREASAERLQRAEREVDELLRAAEADAQVLRDEAGDDAERLRANARDDADRIRLSANELLESRAGEAEEQAAEIRFAAEQLRDRAKIEAREEVDHGRETGRQMVAEAQVVRERILADLARRRQTGRRELEQIRAGRDRLLASFQSAQQALDEIVADVEISLPEARAAAQAAAKAVPVHEVTVEDLENELAAARTVGHPLVQVDESASAAHTDETSADEDGASEDGADGDPGNGEGGAGHVIDLAAGTGGEPDGHGPGPELVKLGEESTGRLPRLTKKSRIVEQLPTGEVPVLRAPDELEAVRVVMAAPAEPVAPTESKVKDTAPAEPVAPTESKVKDTAPAQPDEPTEPKVKDTAPAQPDEPTESKVKDAVPAQPDEPTESKVKDTAPAEPVAPTESKVKDTAPAQPDEPTEPKVENAEPAAAPAEPDEPTEPKVKNTETPKTKALFEQIRAASADTVPAAASAKSGSTESNKTEPNKTEPTKTNKTSTAKAKRNQTKKDQAKKGQTKKDQADTTTSDPVVETGPAERDAQLAPVIAAVDKALKRTLADDQNELLDAVRTASGPPVVTDLIPELDPHVARYFAAVRSELARAFGLGSASMGGGLPDVDHAPARDALRSELITRLRDGLQVAVDEAGGERDDLLDLVRTLSREMRNKRVALAAEHSVLAAFGAGAAAVTGDDPVEWLVDPSTGCSADCEANRLAGPTRLGSFAGPSNYPPAFAGCRCLLRQVGR